MTTLKEVICKSTTGHSFTEGKTYEVVELIPQHETPYLIFPSYVTVRGDTGKLATANAWRFATTEGESMDDYINKHFTNTKETTT